MRLASYKVVGRATLSSNSSQSLPFYFTGLSSIMLFSKVLGVIVIARNGDRYNLYQDPYNYAASNAETTALGEVCI